MNQLFYELNRPISGSKHKRHNRQPLYQLHQYRDSSDHLIIISSPPLQDLMNALTGGNERSHNRPKHRRNTMDISKSMDMTKFKTGAMIDDMVRCVWVGLCGTCSVCFCVCACMQVGSLSGLAGEKTQSLGCLCVRVD